MKKMKFDTFGQKLRLMMFERDLTQDALSRITGLSHETISSWTQDRRIPSITSFMIIVDALELEDYEIIELLKLFRSKK